MRLLISNVFLGYVLLLLYLNGVSIGGLVNVNLNNERGMENGLVRSEKAPAIPSEEENRSKVRRDIPNIQKASVGWIYDVEMTSIVTMMYRSLRSSEKYTETYIFVPLKGQSTQPVALSSTDVLSDVLSGTAPPPTNQSCSKPILEAFLPAVKNSKSFSRIFVIGSTPENLDLLPVVLEIIQSKQIQVTIIIPSTKCPVLDSPGYSAYLKIAETSGGQVLLLPENHTALNDVIELLKPRKVSIGQVYHPTGEKSSIPMLLDSTMTNILISITGRKVKTQFRNPKNLFMNKSLVVTSLNSRYLKIYKIKTPITPGLYKISLKAKSGYSVKITADSNLNFRYWFKVTKQSLEKKPGLGHQPIQGTPSYLIIQIPKKLDMIPTKAEILTTSGDVIRQVDLYPVIGSPITYKSHEMFVSPLLFLIKVIGYSSNKDKISRVTPGHISSISEKLPAYPSDVTTPKVFYSRGVHTKVPWIVNSMIPFEQVNSRIRAKRDVENVEYLRVRRATPKPRTIKGEPKNQTTTEEVPEASAQVVQKPEITDAIHFGEVMFFRINELGRLTCYARSKSTFEAYLIEGKKIMDQKKCKYTCALKLLKKFRSGDDGKVFICRIKHQDGGLYKTMNITIIDNVPKVLVPTEWYFLPGRKSSIVCNFEVNVAYEQIWVKVPGGETTRHGTYQMGNAIIFDNPTEEDEGYYDCIVRTSGGVNSGRVLFRRVENNALTFDQTNKIDTVLNVFWNNATYISAHTETMFTAYVQSEHPFTATFTCKELNITFVKVCRYSCQIKRKILKIRTALPKPIFKLHVNFSIESHSFLKEVDIVLLENQGYLQVPKKFEMLLGVPFNITAKTLSYAKPTNVRIYKSTPGKMTGVLNTQNPLCIEFKNPTEDDAGDYDIYYEFLGSSGFLRTYVYISKARIILPEDYFFKISRPGVMKLYIHTPAHVRLNCDGPVGIFQDNNECRSSCFLKSKFVNFGREIEGRYNCTVKYNGGSTTATTNVHLIDDTPTVESPEKVLFIPGKSIEIPCNVTSKLTHSVRWFKASKGTTTGKHDKTTNAFVFDSPTLEDQGDYDCVGVTSGGLSYSRTHLKQVVKESNANESSNTTQRPLQIVALFTQYTSCEDSAVVMQCYVHSDVPMTVRWFYKGKDTGISKTCPFSCLSDLRINEVDLYLTGEYNCTASTSDSMVSQIINLKLYGDPPEVGEIVKTYTPMKKFSLQGLIPIHRFCSSNNYSDFLLYNRHKDVIISSKKLTEEEPTELTEGYYDGLIPGLSGLGLLKFYFYNDEPINMYTYPSRLYYSDGDNVTLQCYVSGKPNVSVRWLRLLGEEDLLFEYESSENSAFLTIPYLNKRHAGEYVCQAAVGPTLVKKITNLYYRDSPDGATSINDLIVHIQRYNKNSGKTYLNCSEDGRCQCERTNNSFEVTFSPPKLVAHQNYIEAKMFTNIKLYCPVVSFPRANIQWKRADGRSLNNNERIRLLSFGELHMESLKAEDAGTYICQGNNELGTISKGLHVHVVGYPSRLIEVGVNGTLKLLCELNPDAYQENFMWFKNGKPIKSSMFGKMHSRELIIQDAAAGDAGNYTCALRQSDGIQCQNFRVEPEPKKPPVKVYGKSHEMLTFNCSNLKDYSSYQLWMKNGIILFEDQNYFPILDLDLGAVTCIIIDSSGIRKTDFLIQINKTKESAGGNGIISKKFTHSKKFEEITCRLSKKRTIKDIKKINESNFYYNEFSTDDDTVLTQLDRDLLEERIQVFDLRSKVIINPPILTYICHSGSSLNSFTISYKGGLLRFIEGDEKQNDFGVMKCSFSHMSYSKKFRSPELFILGLDPYRKFEVYQCQIGNAEGKFSLPFLHGMLSSPVFIQEKYRKFFRQGFGTQVELDCSAYGNPEPIITWYKDGEIFNRLGHFPILKFLMDEKTEGNYKCVVSSPGLEMVRKFKVVSGCPEPCKTIIKDPFIERLFFMVYNITKK